jgi:hypothetical protein
MNMGKVLDYFGKYDDAVAAVTYAKLTG